MYILFILGLLNPNEVTQQPLADRRWAPSPTPSQGRWRSPCATNSTGPLRGGPGSRKRTRRSAASRALERSQRMSTEEQSTRQARARDIGCTDSTGHDRTARVFPLSDGRVGMQPPSGEQFELSAVQLRDLLSAAREAAWESHTNYDPALRTTVVGGTCS